MHGLYFDEFQTGQVFKHAIRCTVTEADNVFFSALTHNPRRCTWMRNTAVDISVGDTTLGTTVANLGRDEVRFPKAVFHGDTTHCETEVIEMRASRSRPQNGIVVFLHRAYNQNGNLIASCKRSALMLRNRRT
jgi:acyl dehydratase